MTNGGRPASAAVLSEARQGIDEVITAFLAARRQQLLHISPRLEPVAEAAAGYLAGGKRIRPLFCYWGWRGAGGDPDDERIFRAAAALEFVQACALAHDDVMDASDSRRGQPSLHRRFGAWHRDQGRIGDGDRFGDAAAILLGDLFLSWSDEALHTSGFPATQLQVARTAFDAMRTEVVAGQYLDMEEQSRPDVDLAGAEVVNRFKTAKYTVERPLHVGGLLAGAPEPLLQAYTSFGVPVGEAFQLRDDLLGVFGDEATTGKPSGDDITEGKHTVLMALALQRCSPTEAAQLRRSLGCADADIDAVRSILNSSGARDEVERLITTRREQALLALDDPRIEPESADALRDLAIAATQRTK